MKKIMVRVKCLLVLCVVLAIVPIIYYTIYFSGASISHDTQTWGAFGNYVGGLVSAIVGVGNLGVLVAIAVLVEKLNTHRHLNEFRYYALTTLHNQFDNLKYTSASFRTFKNHIESFSVRNHFLFKDFEEKLKNPINQLSERLSEEIVVLESDERRAKKEKVANVDETDFDFFSGLKIKPDDPMLEIKNLLDGIIAPMQQQILTPN